MYYVAHQSISRPLAGVRHCGQGLEHGVHVNYMLVAGIRSKGFIVVFGCRDSSQPARKVLQGASVTQSTVD